MSPQNSEVYEVRRVQKTSDPHERGEVVCLRPRVLGERLKKLGSFSHVRMDCCSFADTEGSKVIVWWPYVEDIGEGTRLEVNANLTAEAGELLAPGAEERPLGQFVGLGVKVTHEGNEATGGRLRSLWLFLR